MRMMRCTTFTLLGFLLVGGNAVASERCPPASVVRGPKVLVRSVTEALVARGIQVEPDGLPPGACGLLEVELEPSDAGLLVRIRDPWGRSAERRVKDPLTAATLVETWARMDLLDEVATSTAVASPVVASPVVAAPVVAAPVAVSPIVVAPVAVAPVVAAPIASSTTAAASITDEPIVAKPLPAEAEVSAPVPAAADAEPGALIRFAAETGVGRDRQRWLGGAVGLCGHLAFVCLGIEGRYAMSESRRSTVDVLAIADLPITFGPFALTPGVGIGGGWLIDGDGRDRPNFQSRRIGNFEDGDDDHSRATGLRAEAHVSLSLGLLEALRLEVGMSASAAPELRHGLSFGNSDLTIVRGHVGLVWGIP